LQLWNWHVCFLAYQNVCGSLLTKLVCTAAADVKHQLPCQEKTLWHISGAPVPSLGIAVGVSRQQLLCKPTWKVSDETFVGGVSMPWIPWLAALGWIYICDQKAEWI
jgi:hypothetical protein